MAIPSDIVDLHQFAISLTERVVSLIETVPAFAIILKYKELLKKELLINPNRCPLIVDILQMIDLCAPMLKDMQHQYTAILIRDIIYDIRAWHHYFIHHTVTPISSAAMILSSLEPNPLMKLTSVMSDVQWNLIAKEIDL
jgi:hypothetical protein